MADIFFGKFSELISSEKILDNKKTKDKQENHIKEPIKSFNIFNKKILIYVSGAILLGIVIFFSI